MVIESPEVTSTRESHQDPSVLDGDLYIQAALRHLPRLLVLLDTNIFRPTYGCFDREYWHFRTADFPCAMHQSCVLPMALLFETWHPDNPLYRSSQVRDWILAASRYAAQSANSDASGDDYYPGERALGATAFSLNAICEAYLRLEFDDEPLRDFIRRRANWVSASRETGNISNHHALAALTLLNVHRVLGETQFLDRSRDKIQDVLDHQSDEGWFAEYDGCDPGYDTWTIGYLAQYLEYSADLSLLEPLRNATSFVAKLVHPDGTVGGPYGSRESSNFYPHGFELLAKRDETAAWIADRFLQSLRTGSVAQYEDDRTFHHHMESYLLAHEYHADRQPVGDPSSRSVNASFPQAGLHVIQDRDRQLVISTWKGGAFRSFEGESQGAAESGIVVRTDDGTVLQSNFHDDSREVISDETSITVKGSFHENTFTYASPLKLVLFRILNIAVTFSPRLSRLLKSALQKFLILNKTPSSIVHERRIDWSDELVVRDTIRIEPGTKIVELAVGSNATTRYTAIGEICQPNSIDTWQSLNRFIPSLNRDGSVSIERKVNQEQGVPR